MSYWNSCCLCSIPSIWRVAGRVCRRWYQVSCRLGVQVRSIQGRYPSRHQRQLAQLDPGLAHQQLRCWYEQLPGSAPQRDSLGQLLHRALPAPALFCRLTQELLRSAQLSFHGGNLSLRCEPWDHGAVRYSPDGRWLVRETASRLSAPPALGLWRQEARGCPSGRTLSAGQHRPIRECRFQYRQPQSVHQSTTPASCMSGIVRTGLSGSLPVPSNCVIPASSAPDSAQMAAAWSFSKTTGCCCLRKLPAGYGSSTAARRGQGSPGCPASACRTRPAMHFSDDSAHCLFIDRGRAFVFDDHADGWQVQELRARRFPGFFLSALWLLRQLWPAGPPGSLAGADAQ